jgi:hypothetical protein
VTGPMRKMSVAQLGNLWRDFFEWSRHLTHTPYGKFPKASGHRFGVLRVWPKFKSLDPRFLVLEGDPPLPVLPAGEVVCSWETLGWRPLVSYSGHYWKRLLSLLSRWCSYTVERFGLGFAVGNPRIVARKLQEFNNQYRRGESLVGGTYDIKEFFPSVPRDVFERIVKFYITRHLVESPEDQWF